MTPTIRAAVVQAEPAVLDAAASVEKVRGRDARPDLFTLTVRRERPGTTTRPGAGAP